LVGLVHILSINWESFCVAVVLFLYGQLFQVLMVSWLRLIKFPSHGSFHRSMLYSLRGCSQIFSVCMIILMFNVFFSLNDLIKSMLLFQMLQSLSIMIDWKKQIHMISLNFERFSLLLISKFLLFNSFQISLYINVVCIIFKIPSWFQLDGPWGFFLGCFYLWKGCRPCLYLLICYHNLRSRTLFLWSYYKLALRSNDMR
jgi:hypothetical protein